MIDLEALALELANGGSPDLSELSISQRRHVKARANAITEERAAAARQERQNNDESLEVHRTRDEDLKAQVIQGPRSAPVPTASGWKDLGAIELGADAQGKASGLLPGVRYLCLPMSGIEITSPPDAFQGEARIKTMIVKGSFKP